MNKLVTVLMVTSLILGLTLAACAQKPAETPTPAAPPAEQAAPPPAEQTVPPPVEQPAAPPAAPPVAKELSYQAKTYANSQYGFSVQYPDTWVERPEIVNGTIIAVFGVPGLVPGVSLSVRDADAPLTADWIVAANTAEGNSGVKVTSDVTPTTLDDGTPAFQYSSSFQSSGYSIDSFATSTDKNGKRIRATVWTISDFAPVDPALFSEIAHTLSVK